LTTTNARVVPTRPIQAQITTKTNNGITPNMALQTLIKLLAQGRTNTTIRHFTTVSPNIRAYAAGFDKNGSPIYWFYDAVTNDFDPVDSDGRKLNPFNQR
jgi:hypothetical protein